MAKTAEAMKKLKGYHVKYEVKSQRYNGEFSGIVKADACDCKGAAVEMFAKLSNYLAKTDNGRIVPPNQLDSQSDAGRAAATFRNPAAMLAEAEAAAGQNAPELKGEEKVGEQDCRMVTVSLTNKQKEALLKELGSKVATPIPIPNAQQFVDMDKTKAAYTMWVSIKDLRILKYTFELKPAAKAGGLPPGMPGGISPDQWQADVTVTHSKFDEELDWQIPKEVQTKLGFR
jgi:hypothetical protein